MIWKQFRAGAFTALGAPALIALALVALHGDVAQAATNSANINAAGSFDVTLAGSGTAHLNGASGNYKLFTSLPFGGGFHSSISFSAQSQTVPLTIPTISPHLPASSLVNLTYGNITPGTPLSVNSFNADLNGNANVPFTINVGDIAFHINNIGDFDLRMTVHGLITDIRFDSTGPSEVANSTDPPNLYFVPGNFAVTYEATVTAELVDIPLFGSLDLGQVGSLPSSTSTSSALLPGFVNLSDLQNGLPPFPNDLLANFAVSVQLSLPLSTSTPFAVHQSNNVPDRTNGITRLDLDGTIDANLSLSNPAYNLTGTFPQVLVPEPSTSGLGLLGAGVVGMVACRRLMKRGC